MSKRIVLKKKNKIFIGIPTTVYERLGVCDETVRRWIRDNKGGGHFEENGYDVFLNIKNFDQYELMLDLLRQAKDLNKENDHKEEGITLENLNWLIGSRIKELNK